MGVVKLSDKDFSLGIKFEFGSLREFDMNQNFYFTVRFNGQMIPNCVFHQLKRDKIVFHLRTPLEGEYKVDMYGINSIQHSKVDLICSYVIINNKKRDYEVFPFSPEIGWGKTFLMDALGVDIENGDSATLQFRNGKFNINVTLRDNLKLKGILFSAKEEASSFKNRIKMEIKREQITFHFRLKEKGEYGFQLSAFLYGIYKNICNYFIVIEESSELNPFPRTFENCIGQKIPFSCIKMNPTMSLGEYGFLYDGAENIQIEIKHSSNEKFFGEFTNVWSERGKVMGFDHINCNNWADCTTFEISDCVEGEYGFNLFTTKSNIKENNVNFLNHVLSAIILISGEHKKCKSCPEPEIPFYKSITNDPSFIIDMICREKPNLLALSKNSTDSLNFKVEKIFVKENNYERFQIHFKEKFGEYTIFFFSLNIHNGLIFQISEHLLYYIQKRNLKVSLACLKFI